MSRSLKEISDRTLEIIKTREREEETESGEDAPPPYRTTRKEKGDEYRPHPRDTPGKKASYGRPRSSNPLLAGPFTPCPVPISKLAAALGETGLCRGLARALLLVVLDLARFTSNEHGDCVVTNSGISKRTGLGLPSVKATIKLLFQMNVLRKTWPSPSRLAELQKDLPGGFGANRRYLIWNPRSKWQIPRTRPEMEALAKQWQSYVNKKVQDEIVINV